jgi:hypothetical protein
MAVVVGEQAAEINFRAHESQDWTQTVELVDSDGVPWSWTGKTAAMKLSRRRSGGTAVVSLTNGSGLNIGTAGQVTITINFDAIPPWYYRYDLVETVTASGADRPVLTGWFDVEGSTV